jgi:hypothetical protein
MKNIFRMVALGLAVLVGSAGLVVAQDRDDDRYDRDYRQQVAREDNWNRKPYNPNPRGRYAWANHGYRGEFGNLNEYQEHYAEAYRNGYMSAFHGSRGYDHDDYRGYGYGR